MDKDLDPRQPSDDYYRGSKASGISDKILVGIFWILLVLGSSFAITLMLTAISYMLTGHMLCEVLR